MSWPLPEKLPGRSKRVLVPRDAIETCFRILNNLIGRGGTTITKTAAPSAQDPWIIESGATDGGGTEEGLPAHDAATDGYLLQSTGVTDPVWAPPPGDVLPEQSGHAGEVLKTDGTAAVWIGLSVLLGTLLEGQGSGYLYWNDTSNVLDTDYSIGFNRIFGGTGIASRLFIFKADGTADTTTLADLLGGITATKTAGMVLTYVGGTTGYKWDWVRAE